MLGAFARAASPLVQPARSRARERRDGYLTSQVFGDQPLDQVVADVDLGPLNGADIVQALKAGPYHSRTGSPGPDNPVYRLTAPMSANALLSIKQDPVKGAVLVATLTGSFPGGGFGLPLPKPLSELAQSANHFFGV